MASDNLCNVLKKTISRLCARVVSTLPERIGEISEGADRGGVSLPKVCIGSLNNKTCVQMEGFSISMLGTSDVIR